MAQKVLHKKSVQKGVKPKNNALDYGEIAVNYNAEEPFLSIKTNSTGSDPYVKFVDEAAVEKKIKVVSDNLGSHTHTQYENQNAFSKVTVGSTTVEADAVTDTLTIAKSGAITVSADAANDKITIGISTGTTSSTVARGDHNHDGSYYKEGEVDDLLAGKANVSHTHGTITLTGDATGSANFTNEGATIEVTVADDSHTHDGRYYTESEINELLSKKSNEGHVHDDRYYTESEIDGKLSGKANVSHTHGKVTLTGDATGSADFTNTGATIEVTVANDSHNHTAKTITDFNDTVNGLIDSRMAANDAMVFKGTIGTSGTVTSLPATHNAGWTYRVITAGTYAGVKCEVGDLIICITDGTAANNAHWTVAQTNIDGAVVGPASATSGNFVAFDGTTGKLIKDSGANANTFAKASHTHGKVTLTGDATGSADFTNTGATINVTVANDSHTHDERYYTESEIDELLSGKANSSHTHGTVKLEGGVTGSASFTNAGATISTTVVDNSHNHNASTITGKVDVASGVTSGATGLTTGKAVYEYAAPKTHNHTISISASDDDVVVLEGTNGTNGVSIKGSHANKNTADFTGGTSTTTINGYGATGTIKIPKISVDKKGHVSASDETITITMPSKQSIPTTLPNPNSLTIKRNGTEVAKYDGSAAIEADITDTNTAHSHNAGVGLVGEGNAGTSGTYTYKAKLRDEANLTSSATTASSGAIYPIAVDKDGYLAVKVPTEQYKGTVTSVKISGTNGISAPSTTITSSGTIALSGVTATTDVIGVSKLINGDLKDKDYKAGEAAAAAHTHSQYKTTQTAVSDPTASGSGLTFIDTIKQGTDGVITATKKNVDLSGYQPKGNYKTTQAAVVDPTASTATSLTFIDTISQDANGVITATKKTVNLSGHKPIQTAVEDPTASTGTSTTFISNISQNKNGVITATKKTLPTSKNVIASANTGTSDVNDITNGNVWLNHLEGSTVTSKHNIKGSGTVTVTTDANGALVVSGKSHSQTVVNDPTASGSGVTFIDTIKQGTDGVITATKKSVQFPNAFTSISANGTTITPDTVTDTLTIAKSGAISITGDATNDKITIGISTGTTSSTVARGDHNHNKTYLGIDATAIAASKVTNVLKFGEKTFDGSAEQTITAADLGLGAALRYCGITTTNIADDSSTTTVDIDGTDHIAEAGCVVFYEDKEFVFNGTKWEELGGETTYKVVQTAVSSPSASGNATAFIDTISQDKNGVITVTKKNVNFSNYKTKQTVVNDPTASGSGVTFIDTISQNTNGVITVTKKNVDLSSYWKPVTATTGATGISKLVTGDLKDKAYTDGEAAAAAHTHTQYQPKGNYQAAGNYKTTQTAVADPTASGSGLTFIDTIKQNTNGVITVTKKSVDLSGYQPKGNYKPIQTAVSDPTASGSSVTFIDTISQDDKGVITATKKNVDFSSYWKPATATTSAHGISKLVNGDLSGYTSTTASATTGLVAAAHHTHSQYQPKGNYQAAGSYKTTQTAVADPTASGNAVEFIDTIKQNTNGVITATKKTVRTFVGASTSAAGSTGLVPAPTTGDTGKYLKGNGTWTTIAYSDISGTPTIPTSLKNPYSLTVKHNGDELGKYDGSSAVEIVVPKSYNIIGSTATATTNAAVASGTNKLYLNHVENSKVTSTHYISGASGIKVYSDASGNTTIKGTTYSVAKYGTNGLIKPLKSYTSAATFGTSAASATTAPTVNALSTTDGRYYAIEMDKDGRAFVNVPWSDTNTDTKVTAVGNHYTPASSTTKSAATASTATDISTTNMAVITGLKMDAAGHITDVISTTLKSTNTDTDTHYTTHMYLGSSTATSDATSDVTNPFIRLFDNTTAREDIQFSGTSNVTVKGKNGVITISGPSSLKNPNALTIQRNGTTVATYDGSSAVTANITDADTNTYTTGATGNGNGTVTFTRNDGSTWTWNAAHTHSYWTAVTATTSAYGITKLSTSTSSTATTLAATPSAVKAAYDLANGKWTAVTATTSAYGISKLVNGDLSGYTSTTASATTGLAAAAYHTHSQYQPKGNYLTSQNTSKNVIASANTGTSDVKSITNGNVWLNHLEGSTVTSKHNIKGSGTVTVTTDANGALIISGSPHTTDTDTNTYTTGATGNGNGTVTFTRNNGTTWTWNAAHTHSYWTAVTATTSAYGITKLSTSTSSTATTLAATPSAVKAAYDLANGKWTAVTATTGATGISKLITGDLKDKAYTAGEAAAAAHTHGQYLTSQNTSKNVIASANTGTSDVKSITNGNVWLNHLEGSTVTSKHNIKGSGSVTVTTDANGALVISGTPHTTDTNTYTTGATGNGNGTVTFTRNNGTTWTWNAAHSHSQYKTVQSPYDVPVVDGKALTFVTHLYQNENGVIEGERKQINLDACLMRTGGTMTGNLTMQSNNTNIRWWDADKDDYQIGCTTNGYMTYRGYNGHTFNKRLSVYSGATTTAPNTGYTIYTDGSMYASAAEFPTLTKGGKAVATEEWVSANYSTTDEKVKTTPLGVKFYLVGSVATGATTTILVKDENAYAAGGNLYVQNGKKVATEEYIDNSVETLTAAANDLNDRVLSLQSGAPILVEKYVQSTRFELGGFNIRDWDDGRPEKHTEARVSSEIYANDNAIYTLNGFYQTSDERKKNFGKDIDVDFDKLKEIPKSYFTWKDDENQKLNIGTSAQKVAEIYPELVTYDEHEDEYSVSYAQLSIVALKAVDKLYEENQMLKEELAMIKKHLGL